MKPKVNVKPKPLKLIVEFRSQVNETDENIVEDAPSKFFTINA